MIRGPRRTLAGAVLAAAVLLAAAPAEAQLGGGAFTSPSPGEDVGVRRNPRVIAGELDYSVPGSRITRVELTLEGPSCPGKEPTLVSGDPIDPVAADLVSPATAGFSFSGVAPFCNGSYVAQVVGTVEPAVGDSPTVESASFNVARPAPPVTATAVVGADRAVTLTWGVPAGWEGGAPPDFTEFADAGYVVQRAVGDGPFVQIEDTGRNDDRTYLDSDAPADAATVRYRVVATRSDGQSRPVEGDLGTAPVATAEFTPEAPPTTPAPPTTRAPAANAPGRGGGGGGGARPAPPQTGPQVDDVFAETLPFDIEPGEADAVLPEGAAQFLQDDGGGGIDDIAGAGILVPSSIAVLLASWALHLRYLARRAAVPG